MARESRNRSNRLTRYGQCVDNECELFKDVQEINHGEFVCSKCGKPLSECPPPKQKNNNVKIIAAIVGLLALLGILAGVLFGTGDSGDKTEAVPADTTAMADTTGVVPAKTDTVIERDTVVQRDTIVQRDTVKVNVPTPVKEKSKPQTSVKSNKEQKVEKPQNASNKGSLRLSYGTYKGDIKGGYPEGMGRLTYNTTRQINRYDSKHRTANPGDYVIGEFVHGFFVQGKHYNSNGELIESLMVGVPANNAFESK